MLLFACFSFCKYCGVFSVFDAKMHFCKPIKTKKEKTKDNKKHSTYILHTFCKQNVQLCFYTATQSCCAHMRPLVDCGRPCVLCTIVRSTMNFDFNKNRLGIKHFASKMVDYHKIWMILFFLFSFCKIVKCEFQNIQKWKSRPCALWAIARSAMGAFCIAKCYNCVAKIHFCTATLVLRFYNRFKFFIFTK